MRLLPHGESPPSPADDLWRAKESCIRAARARLYDELSAYGSRVEEGAVRLIEDRQSVSIGEMFPWILQDVAGVESDQIDSVSVGWLALHAYTLYLDSHLDSGRFADPDSAMSGAVLSQIGLLHLHKVVIGTSYESLFRSSLQSAARGQSDDLHSLQDSPPLSRLERSAQEKNHLLLACAGAIASQTSSRGDVLISFTREALLAAQYLDDIGDWHQDLLERNLSVLLSVGASSAGIDTASFFEQRPTDILLSLVETGALRRILTVARTSLRTAYALVGDWGQADTPSHIFLDRVSTSIDAAVSRLAILEPIIPSLDSVAREREISEIKGIVRYIAQST